MRFLVPYLSSQKREPAFLRHLKYWEIWRQFQRLSLCTHLTSSQKLQFSAARSYEKLLPFLVVVGIKQGFKYVATLTLNIKEGASVGLFIKAILRDAPVLSRLIPEGLKSQGATFTHLCIISEPFHVWHRVTRSSALEWYLVSFKDGLVGWCCKQNCGNCRNGEIMLNQIIQVPKRTASFHLVLCKTIQTTIAFGSREFSPTLRNTFRWDVFQIALHRKKIGQNSRGLSYGRTGNFVGTNFHKCKRNLGVKLRFFFALISYDTLQKHTLGTAFVICI